MSKPTYRLRYFFDYNCGGCLWGDNDASYKKFGIGVLDTDMYDLNGNIIQEAIIQLPSPIRDKIAALDKLYTESLNWNDPGGKSLWDKNHWESFHQQARELYKQISLALDEDFEIVYQQE